ncbi:LPXTG cell wall anchor domain-containing protein [Merdimonas faecis]|uniref:LPXTG cell wall anchor domain-containing protein n=1 Tax=Merdimonas faecis TaxID=1653435 RepID=UPI0023F7DAB0|nr:LPXTG cell wall anchor domain-containing protein [Merdimonas faecis]
MYRKKLLKMCLVTTLAVSMAAANMTAVMPNQAGVVQAADETKQLKATFIDANGNVLGGGDCFVTVDENGNFKYSDASLQEIVPEGYKMTASGDCHYTGSVEIKVEKISVAGQKQLNAIFVDANGNVLGGGDCFVTVDENGNFKYSDERLQQIVPEGYKMTVSGDCHYTGNVEIIVEKVQESTIVKVQFVNESGNVIAGGDYFVNAKDGNFNYADLLGVVPEGYKMTVSGDCSVADGTNGNIITIKVVSVATSVINVIFKDEAGNNLGGGDFFVDPDGDGIFNLSEIKAPVGYTLNLKGDQFVTDYAGKTTILQVTKVNKGTIVNVVFEDRQGNNLGGGDYLVDLDGDGVANYSELSLPVGYKLIETGDFFVKEGNSYKVILDRVGSAIIHVLFKSEGGKNLGGGDFFVDPDGDGVANYSELTLPEGYELIETGDFFVDTEKTYEITLNKKIEGTIINVVYVDGEGNNLGGGDFFVDKDDDGIANYSELDLPEGYELVETGDFFVNAGESYTIELRKIQKGTIINVVFVDEDKNNLGGGDYLVDADGDGIANYSELELPVGYELIETGDFFVKDGEHYTITLKMRETILTVTFEDTEGNVVATETLEAGVAGSPEETHHFVLGEDFQLPEGYQLAEGVDQITDIEIPYGSVGGHTMIVEAVSKEEPVDPENPGTPGNPDDTQESQDTKEEADNQKAAEQKTEDSKTPKTGDNTPVGAAAAAAGVSLAAIAAVIAKKRKF